jgi:hypothetical protein
MPSGSAHHSGANVPAVTAAIFLGLVVMAGVSCGGSVSSAGTDGGSPEGSTSGSASGSASGVGSGKTSSTGSPSSGTGTRSPATTGPRGEPLFDPLAGIGAGCLPSMNHTGGGTVGPQCYQPWAETCGGIEYAATCACPQGTCVCFGPSSTQVIRLPGCSPPLFCPSQAQAYKNCGFPYDPNGL